MALIKDLEGKTFGQWTVLYRAENGAGGQSRWHSICTCGNERDVYGTHLIHGRSVSCGCKNYKNLDPKASLRHGMANTKLHETWRQMRARCNNKRSKHYLDYGGRGISVCDEWDIFENFMEWSLANGYSDELSIDRIDNDGDYEPDNCRWTTALVQMNNRRNTVYVTYKGETKPLKDWCRELDLKYQRMWCRIVKYKWDIDRAFEEKVHRSRGEE